MNFGKKRNFHTFKISMKRFCMTGRSRQYYNLINIRSNTFIFYAIVYFLVLLIYFFMTNSYKFMAS